MGTVTVQIISVAVFALAILGFLWNLHRDMAHLHRDMADLRERMARVEGLLEGFVARPQESRS